MPIRLPFGHAILPPPVQFTHQDATFFVQIADCYTGPVLLYCHHRGCGDRRMPGPSTIMRAFYVMELIYLPFDDL